MNKRKLDIDHTRERLLAFGPAHVAEQLDPLLLETAPHASWISCWKRSINRYGVSAQLTPVNLSAGHTLADFDFAFQPTIERFRIENAPPRA